ncbi:Frataxin [Hyphodiscus hymeniophilus]|uniref:ferroxidase n=1 Tax=Hyphodiscus hymeniophilus TaxID=353542 RepID=A0A9P7AU95_9HELO|nr:Frataxin [Hyphodiscus hymeniophilus]
MVRNTLFKLTRSATRQLSASSSATSRSSLIRQSRLSIVSRVIPIISTRSTRPFSSSPVISKGLSPDSEDPRPKEAESNVKAAQPAELTNEEYHELADAYMDDMVERMEQLQEEKDEVDVEYSAGVLNFVFPPVGTYVINKQPPNKQIWLSSPISGPKRYDYVYLSEGQDSKEGTGAGDWVYLRDMSSLSSLLLSEVGVDLSEPLPPPSQSGGD